MLYRFESYELDVERHEFRAGGEVRVLEPQVFDLLRHLIENSGRLISRDELMEVVWRGRIVSESTVDARMHAARQAVDDDGRRQARIKTVPRRGYRFLGEVEILAGEGEPTTGQETGGPVTAPAVIDKPSIAVLPFDNMSGDPEQEYFADGMTEDITTGLSKFGHLMVIARSSTLNYKGQTFDLRSVANDLGVRYVMEGSIRQSGDRIRVTAQLIDASTATQLWAERYDRQVEDIFAVQDELTAAIVSTIAPEIDQAEYLRGKRKPPESLDAWDLLQKGIALLGSGDRAEREAAIGFFDGARKADPAFPEALARSAHVRVRYVFHFPSEQDGTYLAEAEDLVKATLRLDSGNTTAFWRKPGCISITAILT
ncbi:MAG: hypothetical protein HN705_05565 [Rhodospirillales bacterium]|jgi:TolB-like protein|nr:hypothetical protein [Rhodospirillales bacterium]